MKALLEKVKYLKPTHRQPQGDSEKAKTPSRNPIFTTFAFHLVPAFLMDQTPKLNGYYGHTNILPT